MNTCADCGGPCRREYCTPCSRRRWWAARAAEKRAELTERPIPQYNIDRTDEEQAEADARVAELAEAEGDTGRLSEAATETLRRHVARRGAPPL